jgi:hypothetical protein
MAEALEFANRFIIRTEIVVAVHYGMHFLDLRKFFINTQNNFGNFFDVSKNLFLVDFFLTDFLNFF